MKRLLKKLSVVAVAILMSCALCLGIFAGCSGKYDLTVWIFCSANDADTNATLINAWAENYYNENQEMFEDLGKSEIKVKFDYDISDTEYFELLQNKIASNDAEDIIYVSPKYIKAYAAAGTTLDLTEYVDWDKYGVENIYEGAISSYAYNSSTKTVGSAVEYDAESQSFKDENGDGNGIYALPKDYSSFALAYNQNFFSDTLKTAYTTTAAASGVYYVNSDGTTGAAAPYITIGRTVRYFPFNFYRFSTYDEALAGGDPIAALADLNGGYDVTIMGWPGDTYDTGVEDDPETAYDESLGYVVYSYAEYSAMTYAVCYFAQIADRDANGTHTLMTWLNDDYYGTNNYVYGNDQYEGTLYLTAWLLGNGGSIINDTYTSVDASGDYVLNESGTSYTWVDYTDLTKSTKFGEDLNVYLSDYGVNSEAFIEAYAAFLAYGSDWNGNSYYSGNPNESESTRGGWSCFTQGRCVFYGLGTWDFQSLNSTSTKYLNLGIMPEPVSEDYAVYSRIKNAAYKSETYGDTVITDSSYNVYNDDWTINTSASGFSAWKANENERQDKWYARMDTVGYGVNANLLSYADDAKNSWKIEAAADLCAWMTIGEDIQTALTYSGAQFSSRTDQADDYVNYQSVTDGTFQYMLTPEGNAANTLTVTASEITYANTYLTDTLGITLSGTTLTGNDIWQFAVAAANLFYLEAGRTETAEEFITSNFPSLVPYLNEYFKSLANIEGVAMAYKALNMIPLDRDSRNLQVRMPLINGKADSCTYTYSSSWYSTPFSDNKGKALIAYNVNKDVGSYQALLEANLSVTFFSVGSLADIKIGTWDGAVSGSWSGAYYTPLAFCLSLVQSVSNTLQAESLNAELAVTG